MCLGAASLALAMVMAGTGDLECFKLLRSLRWKIGGGVEYGHHMCIGMAIGLLFLGGGRVSLSDSNESIAVLLAAFFPRFPTSTEDNQYHLQVMIMRKFTNFENACMYV
jgi:anaphase-promoting complex subunit 1